jgi:uncharacterized protein (DUF1330 family)
LVAGVAVGAATMQMLHAQATPAAYSVTEIDVTDQAAYAPISAMLTAENQKTGAKQLVRGGKLETIEGTAPKRVVINHWKSMDEAKKFYSSAVVKKAFEDRKKFTSGARTYIVEALPN